MGVVGMFRIRNLIFPLIFVSFCFAEKMTLATWNIRYANVEDSARGNAWSKRLGHIVQIIRFYDFDIVGMQEVRNGQAEDLEKALPEYELIQKDSSESNLILFKRDSIVLLDSGKFWYSETPYERSLGWDSKIIRFCAWAKFSFRGKVLVLFNAHWDHKGRLARKESAWLTVRQMAEISNGDASIFCGDLNTDPKSSPIEILKASKFLKNASENAEIRYAPANSYNGFTVSRPSDWQLDHIFTSREIRIFRYGVLNDMYWDEDTWRYPSDHLPVMIQIRWP